MLRRILPLVALIAATSACRMGEQPAQANADNAEAALAEVDVPTEEQAAEEAALTITEENADDEFAKLKAEIEGDTSDF